jgi:hypothetical protein
MLDTNISNFSEYIVINFLLFVTLLDFYRIIIKNDKNMIQEQTVRIRLLDNKGVMLYEDFHETVGEYCLFENNFKISKAKVEGKGWLRFNQFQDYMMKTHIKANLFSVLFE